jgi:hypothetical protein
LGSAAREIDNISVSTTKLIDQDTVIEDALTPLFTPGSLFLLKEDPAPSVNIIIEGIAGDRFIIRLPRQRNIPIPYQEARGDICMVNPCYNWFTALNGLIEALKAEGN